MLEQLVGSGRHRTAYLGLGGAIGAQNGHISDIFPWFQGDSELEIVTIPAPMHQIR